MIKRIGKVYKNHKPQLKWVEIDVEIRYNIADCVVLIYKQ